MEDNEIKIQILEKYASLFIWAARMHLRPVYLGPFSYGRWYYSGMLQYQVIKNKNEMDKLDIFLSIDGIPKKYSV